MIFPFGAKQTRKSGSGAKNQKRPMFVLEGVYFYEATPKRPSMAGGGEGNHEFRGELVGIALKI